MNTDHCEDRGDSQSTTTVPSAGMQANNNLLVEAYNKTKKELLAADGEILRLRTEVSRLKANAANPETLDIVKELRAQAKQQNALLVKVHEDILRAEEKAKVAEQQANIWKQIATQARPMAVFEEASNARPGKRSVPESSIIGPDTKKSKIERSIPCTRCWALDLTCTSNTDDCSECVRRGKGNHCRRVKCKNYKTGTCSNKKCKFAHEDDGCRRVIKHIILKPHKTKTSEKDFNKTSPSTPSFDAQSDIEALLDKIEENGDATGTYINELLAREKALFKENGYGDIEEEDDDDGEDNAIGGMLL